MGRFANIILMTGLMCAGCQSGPVSEASSSRFAILPSQIIDVPAVRLEAAIAHILAYLALEGYTIETYSEELGFINATKPVTHYSSDEEVATSLLEVTIHVKELEAGSEGCNVKVHFVGKDFDRTGAVAALRPIQDDVLYDTFLRRIQAHIRSSKPSQENDTADQS